MSTIKNNFSYSRTIRLAPAVGDWTTIQYREDLDGSHVSSVQNIGFNSLARDKLRYAHLLHYRLGEEIIQKLSTDLDIKVELHSITASQMSYQDYLVGFQDKSVQYHLSIPSVGKSTLILESGLADYMVQRLTGGSGNDPSYNTELSEIELAILQSQIEQILPLFSHAWKSLFLPEQIQIDFSSGPVQFDAKMSLREAITVFSFQATYGNENLKRFSWIYPSGTLRKLLHARSVLPDPMRRRVFLQSKTIRSLKTDAKVILGRASLTMKELRELQVGDIIPLDTTLNSPLELLLGKTSRFQIQAGVHQNRLCGQLIFMESDYTAAPIVSSSHEQHAPPEPSFQAPPPPPPVVPPPPLPVTPPPIVQAEPEDSRDDFTDDWSAGYTGAPSSHSSDELEAEDLFEPTDSDLEEAEDDEDDIHSFDASEPDDEMGDWGSPSDDQVSEAPSPPVNTAKSTEADDDLSWDSLDDHF